MKKQLLTTTALVAAGAFAAAAPASAADMKAPVKLAVKGYLEYVIGMPFDKDMAAGGPDVPSIDNHIDGEIWFKGTAKLDNGITVHADVEMEAFGVGANNADHQIDEGSMDIRGSFGQLTLGQKDNAGNQMTTGYAGSWATNVGQNLAFDRTDWVKMPEGFTGGGARFNATLNDVRLRSGGENDSVQISYFTPRFEGVQLGASYIPAFRQGAAGQNTAGASTAEKYHNGFAAGINYVGKFDGGMGLGLAAGYLTASAPTNMAAWEDMSAYVLAARADFGPFRVAAAFKENKDVSGGALDGRLYDVGTRYTFGPNAVSASYSSGEVEGNTMAAGEDKETGAAIAYRRVLGPGVIWRGTLFYSEFEDEGGMSTDGWTATTSVLLVF